MPLPHKEITDLVAGATTEAATLVEYRQAAKATVVRLAEDMAAALGSNTGYRRITPVLGTVVQTIASKLEVDDQKLKASKVKDTKQIAHWLGDNQWSLIERELYEVASRDGTAFVLTRWTDDGPRYTVREAFDGVTGCKSVYKNGELAFILNGWKTDKTYFLDCYYPDRIEKYTRVSEGQWARRRDAEDEQWPIPWTDDTAQPLGIAITEFDLRKSDIEDALQIGRDLNEALLDMVATSRLQGWPQRYLKGQKNPNILLNEAGQPIISPLTGKPFPRTMQMLPGSVMLIGAEAELGQLEGATPNSAALDKLLELLSLITKVPTHYFNGQWPSGVALIQAESQLNHKVEGHQGRLTSAIVEMLRLTIRLSNYFAGTTYNPDQEITIPWCSPQIETEDLKREREKATTENIVKLYEARLMSRFVAIQAIHPDWSDDDVNAEIARLDAASPATPLVPTSQLTGDTTND